MLSQVVFSIVVLAKEHHDSMASTNGLAQWFERTWLFGYGRHFWNTVGVAGFSLMATGAIFALESRLPSPAPSVRKYETSADEAGYDWAYYQFLVDDFCGWKIPEYMTKEDIQMCEKFNEWVQQGHPEQGNKNFGYYAGIAAPGKRWSRKLIGRPIQREYTNRYEKEDKEARERYSNSKIMKSVRLGLSLPLASSGLGLVAVTSLMSAVLSIERNTRKE